jgi:hypothetical protein
MEGSVGPAGGLGNFLESFDRVRHKQTHTGDGPLTYLFCIQAQEMQSVQLDWPRPPFSVARNFKVSLPVAGYSMYLAHLSCPIVIKEKY